MRLNKKISRKTTLTKILLLIYHKIKYFGIILKTYKNEIAALKGTK